jgi:hypothetical protein
MVNRGDATGSNEWRDLPIEKQMAWRIPITTMFNLTHLRLTHPVILISEYLRLHDLSPDLECSNGAWSRTLYHAHANIFESDPGKRPSLHVIENGWFDPKGMIRVDVLPSDMKVRGSRSADFGDYAEGRRGDWGTNLMTALGRLLSNEMSGDQPVLSWERARAIVEAAPTDVHEVNDAPERSTSEGESDSAVETKRQWDVSTDEGLERVLRSNGWEVLYTYEGA